MTFFFPVSLVFVLARLIFSVVRFTLFLIFRVLDLALAAVRAHGKATNEYTPVFLGTARVIDGDTVAFTADNGQKMRVRLWGIDAPEADQPGGTAATQRLKRLIGTGVVRLEAKDIDAYGRVVGLLTSANMECLNLSMVASGYARAYAAFTTIYVRAEAKARKSRAGLWACGALNIHPADWRRRR